MHDGYDGYGGPRPGGDTPVPEHASKAGLTRVMLFQLLREHDKAPHSRVGVTGERVGAGLAATRPIALRCEVCVWRFPLRGEAPVLRYSR
jgi:hypothetical protein